MQGFLDLARFLGRVQRRFGADGCFNLAAALAYASLFALVPMVAIALAVLSAFPVFDAARGEVQRIILVYLAPPIGAEAEAYFSTFVANTSRLTWLGIAGLAVSAVVLLATIEEAFNAIWRVSTPRRLGWRLLAYIAALTVGPLLVGAALSLSTLAAAWTAWPLLARLGDAGTVLVPPALTIVGFAVVYYALPNRRVHIFHAAAAGLVAGLLFELLKGGFALYLRMFPAYQTIYGALAALPIFLIWMYLAWVAVLFGAELAAAWPEREAAPTAEADRPRDRSGPRPPSTAAS